MHPVELFMQLYCFVRDLSGYRYLSEGSFVRNVFVQIPKFDAKPDPNHNFNPSTNPNSNPNVSDK